MALPLKDWFRFQVWTMPQDIAPELRSLSEIRDWFNETGDDQELVEEIDNIKSQVGTYDPDSKRGQTITEYIEEIHSLMPSEGTYVAAKAASCEFEYDDDPLTKISFGAKLKGTSGNSLDIAFVINGDLASEVVTVEDGSIKVDLAYADSAITSTMASVKTAIEAHEAVNALIEVVVTGEGTTLVTEGSADFAGGVDGFVGDQGKIIFDEDAVYIAITACTVSDSSGWKKIADLS